MSLFQNTVIKKHLSSLSTQEVSVAYSKFKAHFHDAQIQQNIRESKEEQYQGEFLIDLFVNVLGYTKNPTPNFNLTTEYKNLKDSKKADGAIILDNKAIAVIELKGTETTDLSKIESQAFGYKNNQPECTYIITSNFEKLRFYIDNAIEFLEFNLFTLSEQDFQILYLCLAFQSINKNIPKKIKDESISQEDVITKKLYNDYSLFKRELHQNLVALNPQFPAVELFKKSQKLLDRFLFLFFAEDRQLLPPNSVRLILNDWRDLQERDEAVPLYNRFKKYFEYLNTGFKGKRYDVFAYNGGLFKHDEILDSILIDDELLFRHTQKLSEYDFQSEVDVNILGHIFENSLNELDEIKAQLEGKEIDKTKTKRKKDGVFYTPKYITKYIVDNTIGKLCTEQKLLLNLQEDQYTNDKKKTAKAKKELLEILTAYRNWLLQLTICDPACGSGAFLNQALNFLIAEHRYVDELQAKLFGDALVLSDIENSILENNLFGVDLNEESVEIAKLSLWLRTAQPNRKLNDLTNNIKCGNSLIDDPAIAGDKAFNWQKEFPQIFGTDIIPVPEPVAKPIKSKKPNTDAIADDSEEVHPTSSPKERITNIDHRITNIDDRITNVEEPKLIYQNKKRGFDVIIGNPPYVAGKDIEKNLKSYYKSKYVLTSGKFDLYLLFIERVISLLNKKYAYGLIIPNTFLANENAALVRKRMIENNSLESIRTFRDDVFVDASVESVIPICNSNINEKISIFNNENELVSNYNSKEIINAELCRIQTSISISDKKLLDKIDLNSFKLGTISDICIGIQIGGSSGEGNTKEEYISTEKTSDNFKKFIDGKDFAQYYINWPRKFVSYGDWLHRKRDEKYFINPKIIIRQIGNVPISAIDKEGYFTLNTIYNLLITEAKFSLEFIFLQLNSKLVKFYWTKKFSDAKSLFPKIKKSQITEIPISSNYDLEKQRQMSSLYDQMLSLNKELLFLSGKFTTYFSGKYNIQKLSTKLENWFFLDFSTFSKELNKAIKIDNGSPLSKKDEIEWMDVFNEYKQKVLSLKEEIQKTDDLIDNMVYELYNLSPEEIVIVEGK